MLSSSLFISGWRATDSISLPKMKPTPMPAPIEPRPAPTPRAIALPAPLTPSSVTAAATGDRSICEQCSFLVACGGRSAYVDRGEGREDKGLKSGHEPHLEDEEDECQGEGECPEGRDPEQHREPAAHEEQQQVAGEDVGEETHRERDQPYEVRDHLDHEDRRLAERAHRLQARREPAGEVWEEALGPDPFDVVR